MLRIISIALVVALVIPWAAVAAPPAGRAPIYDESADAKADIAAAIERARSENKRVLVIYGANWCGWCYKLDEFLKTDEAIAPVVRAEYEVVHVDVNDGKNNDVAESYGAALAGLPYLTILDAAGKVVVNHDTGSLETGPKHDPEKVLALLNEHKAPAADAEQRLTAALAEAKAANKRVMLRFGAPWCGWCKRLDALLADPQVEAALTPHLVLLKVDIDRDTNGQAVQERYQTAGGIPWYCALAGDGVVVATSSTDGGNIGYPLSREEIDRFMGMLTIAAPGMTDDQRTVVNDKLLQAADEIEKARRTRTAS